MGTPSSSSYLVFVYTTFYLITRDCVNRTSCAGREKLLTLFANADEKNGQWCVDGTFKEISGIESRTRANEPMPKAALISMFLLVVVFTSFF